MVRELESAEMQLLRFHVTALIYTDPPRLVIIAAAFGISSRAMPERWPVSA